MAPQEGGQLLATRREVADRLYREVCDLADQECRVRRELRLLRTNCPHHGPPEEVAECYPYAAFGKARAVVRRYCPDCRLLLSEATEFQTREVKDDPCPTPPPA